jgi:fructan beta-fructosidase
MVNQYRRFQEKDRPIFHYTTESKWLNDPNGLIYFDGEYHLYHQYNCFGKVHWGHAVSRDLVHWEHKPPAIFPRQDGEDWLQPWSGTVVVDWNNSSGLQAGDDPVFLAYFTHSRQPGDLQTQSLAYSNDRGNTWKEYQQNPILANPGIRDFRDPKVFWHMETRRWIMAIVAGDHVKFYSSLNGLEWHWESNFGENTGSHEGVWECPDLFPMQVEGEEIEKWILIISVGGGSVAGGTGMQYFIGHFDGKYFSLEESDTNIRWVDYGQDFYAAISWNEVPDGRRLWIGWMNNWPYANSLPTEPYQGQMSIVRELLLTRDNEGELYLSQRHIKEQKSLRKACFNFESLKSSDTHSSLLNEVRCECFELKAEVEWEEQSQPEDIQLRFRIKDGQYTTLGFIPKQQVYYLDRSHSGFIPHPSFGGRHKVQRTIRTNRIQFSIFVDRQSVEVFADQGRYVLSDLIFPEPASDQIQWNIIGGEAKIVNCTIYPVHSALPMEEEKALFTGRALNGQWAVTSQGIEGAALERGTWIFPELKRDIEISTFIDIIQSFDCGNFCGFTFRMNSTGTKGYLITYEPSTMSIGFYRLTAVGHEMIERYHWDKTNAVSSKLTIKAYGQNIEVYLNGSKIIKVFEPNAYLEGYIGLYVNRGVALYKNLNIEDINN